MKKTLESFISFPHHLFHVTEKETTTTSHKHSNSLVGRNSKGSCSKCIQSSQEQSKKGNSPPSPLCSVNPFFIPNPTLNQLLP